MSIIDTWASSLAALHAGPNVPHHRYRTRTTEMPVEPELGKHQQNMTRGEQIKAVLFAPVPICPNCGHGMDPHGVDPGGICGVGDTDSVRCPCLMTPSAIHNHISGGDSESTPLRDTASADTR